MMELLVWASQLVALAGLIFASCCTGYFIFLAVVSVVIPAKRLIEGPGELDFAVVVPAHNEQAALPTTLESLASLDYPANRFTVYVVADNCEDDTARVAQDHGALPLVRNNEKLRGKGHALAWAFERLLEKEHEGFVVVDADSEIDSEALKVFEQHLSKGRYVLQSDNRGTNPEASPVSYALAVGNALENDLFYRPKSGLGLSVFLRGTGMVFHRSILERFPWSASTIAEDTEYTLNLLREGVKVTFVPEVAVRSPFPVDGEQMRIQRTRWATGNVDQTRRFAAKLLLAGLRSGRCELADAGFTLLAMSKPLVVLSLVGAVLLALLGLFTSASGLSSSLVVWALAVIAALALYFICGVLALGPSKERFELMKRVPRVFTELTLIAVKGLAGAGRGEWRRTPRS